MRGQIPSQPSFVSLINVETMIPEKHPIRVIKKMCDEVLASMSPQLDRLYAEDGAPSIPPETLLKGKVLQALYTVRSDRQLCDRLKTDLLFRWFVDLSLEKEVFDASSYSKIKRACSSTRSPSCSSLRWWSWPGCRAGSPTSTSVWTARSLRPGPR